MKKLLLFIVLLIFATHSWAQKSIPKPNPMRLVNDYAQLMSDYDATILEQKLIALDDSTSNQIVVLTVPSLNGEVIEDVAVNTFREWGIGDKKNNNGVLLLIALNDRKVRIEVGYGLEGAIPDVVANDIINNDIKPAFKQKNYIGGISAAVEHLSKAAAGEYAIKRKKGTNKGDGIIGILVILFVLIIVLAGRGGRGGGGNLIGPLLLSNLISGGSSGRNHSSFGGGFGGGFGGFGGGSSGGGGASGGW